MYFVAVVLMILSAVFYAAGLHEIGSYSADVCRYGGTFCDNPVWVMAVLIALAMSRVSRRKRRAGWRTKGRGLVFS